ncbi:hypothetical protein BLNAU_7499 [Blattamonas nauphoetae]|uniref:Transmembrane protein n=1 Tax=Blattamonas nauphoetae TaxID=2049346 RepID=A0ABQ9Y1I6_9EUKA|nr:hypothetical protein BLNAU_7499 [Blattamonas nauphoetae]
MLWDWQAFRTRFSFVFVSLRHVVVVLVLSGLEEFFARLDGSHPILHLLIVNNTLALLFSLLALLAITPSILPSIAVISGFPSIATCLLLAISLLHSFIISLNVSIVVLISSPNRAITTATMKMLGELIQFCSDNVRFDLVKADLIPQLITSLDPLSLSFAEAEDIHINIMKTIRESFWLATPFGL